jgi:hypothetical protein
VRRLFLPAVIILLALTGPLLADAPARIQNPAKFCDDLFANISPFKAGEIAKKVAVAIGKPEVTETIANGMNLLDHKAIDFSKKVIDNEIGGALRQIVYYVYVDSVGFVYFRLNFKNTSTGWILSAFDFKTETKELFPKDFVEP